MSQLFTRDGWKAKVPGSLALAAAILGVIIFAWRSTLQDIDPQNSYLLWLNWVPTFTLTFGANALMLSFPDFFAQKKIVPKLGIIISHGLMSLMWLALAVFVVLTRPSLPYVPKILDFTLLAVLTFIAFLRMWAMKKDDDLFKK